MTQKRRAARPVFFKEDLAPIPFSALTGKSENVDFEDRNDGVLARGQSRPGRQRKKSSEPLPLSEIQKAELIVCFRPLWEVGAKIEEILNSHRSTGRRRECHVAEMLIFDVLTWESGSYRKTERLLQDMKSWRRLAEVLELAYPSEESIRLSTRPISRTQFSNLRSRVMGDADLRTLIKTLYNDVALAASLDVGALSEQAGSFNHPAASQIVVGDATWIESKFNSESGAPVVDTSTGEILRRGRFDPDARSFHNNDRGPGNSYTITSCSSGNPHERVVLDVQQVPEGKMDSTVFAEFVANLAPRVPGIYGACYDMAARSREVDILQRAGLHAITKVPRVKGGKVAYLSLGQHLFELADGSRREIVVWAIDGWPCIEIVVDGSKMIQQLTRQQTKRRPNKNGWTIYSYWRIPNSAGVPPHLHDAATMIRHDPTVAERSKNKPRTSVLRTIAEGSPEFRTLFGRREDSESINHHIKSRLTDRRARCVGLERNLLHLRGYQMFTAITALTAHGRRTGAPHEKWFGELERHHRSSTNAA